MTILNNIDVSTLGQVIKEAERLAYERCTAVFAFTERVKLNTMMKVNK